MISKSASPFGLLSASAPILLLLFLLPQHTQITRTLVSCFFSPRYPNQQHVGDSSRRPGAYRSRTPHNSLHAAAGVHRGSRTGGRRAPGARPGGARPGCFGRGAQRRVPRPDVQRRPARLRRELLAAHVERGAGAAGDDRRLGAVLARHRVSGGLRHRVLGDGGRVLGVAAAVPAHGGRDRCWVLS